MSSKRTSFQSAAARLAGPVFANISLKAPSRGPAKFQPGKSAFISLAIIALPRLTSESHTHVTATSWDRSIQSDSRQQKSRCNAFDGDEPVEVDVHGAMSATSENRGADSPEWLLNRRYSN